MVRILNDIQVVQMSQRKLNLGSVWVSIPHFSLAKQNTPVGGGGGASPLTNGIFLPNAVPVYDLDENFQMQYDENGKPLYNFKNPIFQDMNVISFAQTDKYATNTYRVLVNPYVDFNFYGVHWKTSLSYDYINLDETQWYNAEHGRQ